MEMVSTEAYSDSCSCFRNESSMINFFYSQLQGQFSYSEMRLKPEQHEIDPPLLCCPFS